MINEEKFPLGSKGKNFHPLALTGGNAFQFPRLDGYSKVKGHVGATDIELKYCGTAGKAANGENKPQPVVSGETGLTHSIISVERIK